MAEKTWEPCEVIVTQGCVSLQTKIVQISRNEVILQVFTLAFHVKVFKFTCCVAAASPLYSQNIFYDCNTILKHCKLLIVLRPCVY